MLIGLFVVLLVVIVFVVILYANDFSLPEVDFFRFKQPNKPLTVLVIFPHPDDETMSFGGTLAKLSAAGSRVVVVDFTHGEAGQTGGECEGEDLAECRAKEFGLAMKELGVKEFRVLNFVDGGMQNQLAEIKKELSDLFLEFEPDVVVTYEPSGVYAHPDHIVLSQAVTESMSLLPAAKLFYTTIAAKQLKHIKLPQTLDLYGKTVDLSNKMPLAPTHKSSFWKFRGRKLLAIRAHRSQCLGKHLPLPLWAFGRVVGVEYLVEAT